VTRSVLGEVQMSLQCKLGSIVVHAEEAVSNKGHHFDVAAILALVNDPEVQEWLAAMRKLSLLPVKR
jgi:hypothetical protein